jgi:hypothetical protein
MVIQFAAKKIDGAYEAALIVDGNFQRAGKGASVEYLFGAMAGTLLEAATQKDGMVASITVNIADPEAK